MIHFALPTTRARRSAVAAVLAPLTPAAYLTLRREAAGLTIAQVAERIAPRLQDRVDAALLIDMLETPGCKARDRDTINRLRAVFPFDPDVYFQLATEPADRHPRVCRGCGCSHWDPCDGPDGTCAWSTDASCTRCAERH